MIKKTTGMITKALDSAFLGEHGQASAGIRVRCVFICMQM